MLASSNFGTAVTAGTFTVKTSSGTATITVDPTTQSLKDVIDGDQPADRDDRRDGVAGER